MQRKFLMDYLISYKVYIKIYHIYVNKIKFSCKKKQNVVYREEMLLTA